MTLANTLSFWAADLTFRRRDACYHQKL